MIKPKKSTAIAINIINNDKIIYLSFNQCVNKIMNVNFIKNLKLARKILFLKSLLI
jgi:hypothetical protein